ncbi:MAG: hypothetical protein DRP63_03880 [Planctomycetota bacterium]|nr:MAG: hypothetical protein DRP63_03880 [Planctomycetota bacterium]
MNPNCFADLARRLMHNISVEAQRTAVSRFYYAAHHFAFAFVVSRGRRPPSQGWKRHRWVIDELRGFCSVAAGFLQQMAEHRRRADYDLQQHDDAWFHKDNLQYVSALYEEFLSELKGC